MQNTLKYKVWISVAAGLCCTIITGLAASIENPYAGVVWDNVEYLHSFSHQHGNDPQIFRDMGYLHLPLSNYYPSKPFYPLPAAFVKRHPEAIGAPNAEQHSCTDLNIHFNVLGGFYTTGSGYRARGKMDISPFKYTFKDLTPFDEHDAPWAGIYRIDIGLKKKGDEEPAAEVNISGGARISPRVFALMGDGKMEGIEISKSRSITLYMRALSENISIEIKFDPTTTGIQQCLMMQGVNRPWRDAFRSALDGTRKDKNGVPIEGMLCPDGGGITINHPYISSETMITLLDFDPRVLGIEIWNHRHLFGGANTKMLGQMRFYELWDSVLRSGRRCYGFVVKDHRSYGRGRNVLLVKKMQGLSKPEQECEALRAYREGRFFGLVGAPPVNEANEVIAPYDYSEFRFSRITLKHAANGKPEGLEIAVTGANRTKRPNTQLRFVTDKGVAGIVNGESGFFAFPRTANGTIECKYVRVEAFAYPDTHLAGKEKLDHQCVAAMNVDQLARLHDCLTSQPNQETRVHPIGKVPVGIVEMIFSQPIMIRP